MKNVFARDEHGNVKHKVPCQNPGCKWPNWHPCWNDGKPDGVKALARAKPKDKEARRQQWRDNIAAAQRERHRKRRELTKERDDLIVKLYREGEMSMNAIATQTGYAQSTVNKVLKRAQREGILKIRPKHYTITRPGNQSDVDI